jgi:hypothetical protein|tara:strand:- start:426 stop:1118 length:693 start_codon:yes stop_codon:yes gene_type:complete
MSRKPPPPPKPRPPKKAPLVILTRASSVDISAGTSRERAKFSGLILYAQTPGISVREVWERGTIDVHDASAERICDVITFQVFAKWAREGKWLDHRKDLWKGVQARVLKSLAGRAVRNELRELDALNTLEGDLLEKMKDAKVRTFEGGVRAALALDDLRSGKRERITKTLAELREEGPGIAGGDGGVIDVAVIPALPPGLAKDDLNDDDIHAAARAIAVRRVDDGSEADE